MTERDFVADMKYAVDRLSESYAFAQWIKESKRYSRRIQRADIVTYQMAYDTLGNVWANVGLRRAICEILYTIIIWRNIGESVRLEYVDRRKVVKPLIVALQSKDAGLRSAAIQLARQLELKRAFPLFLQLSQTEPHPTVRVQAIEALGSTQDPRAIEPLLNIATNRAEPEPIRIAAVKELAGLLDLTARSAAAKIILDPTEAVEVRAEAAEWLNHWDFPEWINIQRALLESPELRLRLAAAYAFMDDIYDVDMSSVRPLWDHILATDETIRADGVSLAGDIAPCHEVDWYEHIVTNPSIWAEPYLISPIPLYDDYQPPAWSSDDGIYRLSDQPTTLAIDPTILSAQILEKWPNAKLNVRHPQPESLILDWLIEGGEEPVMGGLHRNGYWIFLTGLETEVLEVAVVLRGVIPAEYPLLLYWIGHWADYGVEITPDLAQIGFEAAQNRRRDAEKSSTD